MSSEPTSVFITAADGLKLHARCYGEPNDALPVVCLPGLTRTAADFDVLGPALAGDPDHPRRVIALDYRGRGRSDYDPNPGNYSLPVELADLVAVTQSLEASPAIYIGTSRGGILTMLLASLQPAAIAGAVLNDIGPVIEPQGLMRIRSYVGKLPEPKSFDEAADLLRDLFSTQFPRLGRDHWLAEARRTFRQENGRLVPTYDVQIAKALDALDLEQPIPPLWNEFEALARVPVMVIRGANSDILSASTVAAMRKLHPSVEMIEVPDQGHAPPLTEPDLIARIVSFVSCGAIKQ